MITLDLDGTPGAAAFGQPGLPPTWQSARKNGFGTARTPASRIWFTLARGIITEVCYPRVDVAAVRDLQFLVSDGRTFVHEAQRDLEARTWMDDPGVPAYRIAASDAGGRYRLHQRVIADPERDALLVHVVREPLVAAAADDRTYVLFNPQLGNSGAHDHARVLEVDGRTVLVAWQSGAAVALVADGPVAAASVGFVGASDGWRDLKAHHRLEWRFDAAHDGNVALTAEIGRASAGMTLALGFGPTAEAAVATAVAALGRPFEVAAEAYAEGWRPYLAGLALERLWPLTKDGGRLLRTSAMVLAAVEDKTFRGAHVASPAVPWGDTVVASGPAGYRLVWPRDLYHVATARLALGDDDAARRTIGWLIAHQLPDGSWPQNAAADGTPGWTGLQLDEVAWPVLLAFRLRGLAAPGEPATWPMVRRAADFLVASGPSTPQERWEENAGLSPDSTAVAIAALIAAAEFAEAAGEAPFVSKYRVTADAWAARLEAAAYSDCPACRAEFGRQGHYKRLAARGDAAGDASDCESEVPIRNRLDSLRTPECCLMDPSFLTLVRLGVRAAHDPHVESSVAAVDHRLRHETLVGPTWRRYEGDGYGEHADGAPYDGTGVGRPWPLLAGERGHYELAAGRRREALHLAHTLERLANDGGFLPEQIWDGPPDPAHDLKPGAGTGSATPLAWAHAEYIKLLRSIADERVFDLVTPVCRRYVGDAVP